MAQTAILDIQNGCNQACVFCLEDDDSRPVLGNPTIAEVKVLIADLRERGASHITFMGGETFFRKDLGSIIGEARRIGFTRIGVTTNGSILSKIGYLRKQVEAGLDFIEFSLHGHNAEVANAIARRADAFARQAIALAQIDALAVPTIFNVVICEENKDHLLDIARYVVENFPHIPARFKFKFVSLMGRAASEAKRTGITLSYEAVDVLPVGDYLAAHDVPMWFGNFPMCRLGHHAGSSHELSVMAADEQFFDLFRTENVYKATGFQLAGRVRPEATCAACTVRAVCPGIDQSYLTYGADKTLRTRHDDPLPLLEDALRHRLIDPALAPARLAMLAARPDVLETVEAHHVVPRAPDLLFGHPSAPRELELELTEADEAKPAFLKTAHFALSYFPWPDADPYQHSEVVAFLRAAAEAVRATDEGKPSLELARGAVLQAAASQGWRHVV